MRRILQAISMLFIIPWVWGFNLDNAIVPADEIYSGGPGKDGIPAIMKPKFIPVQNAAFLEPGDELISVEINGSAKAYPLSILVWHEVVNDTLNGVPIVVTF